MSSVTFRFDIDTITCIEDGLPNLLDVAAKYQLKFQFYLNLGKSIDRKTLLARRRKNVEKFEDSQSPIAKLSVKEKLGNRNFLRTVFLNPPLIQSALARTNIERLQKEGHQLEMHGGHNHGTWLYRVQTMGQDEFDQLIEPAFEIFCKLFGRPEYFASPGFMSNAMVKNKLKLLGFKGHGDDFGTGKGKYRDNFDLEVLPVTIIGEGTVPILEQGRARGLLDGEVLNIANDLTKNNSYRNFYGHPCFEGMDGLNLFEAYLKSWSTR